MNDAAVTWLETARSGVTSATFIDAKIELRNLASGLQNAAVNLEMTPDLDRAFAEVSAAGRAYLGYAEQMIPTKGGGAEEAKTMFTEAVDRAVELVRDAKPSGQARALGIG